MEMAINNLRITIDFSLKLIYLLRNSGVAIGIQQTVTCIQSILLLKKFDRERLRTIYKITLINRKEDFYHLHKMFDVLWTEFLAPSPKPKENSDDSETYDGIILKLQQYGGDLNKDENEDTEDVTETQGYSTKEISYHKDFRNIPKEDISSVILELDKIAKKYALIPRRKMKESKRSGKINMRKSIQESVKYGGEILNWKYKKKIPSHSRFVIVSDVSGSMELYSFFLLNFLHLLHNHNRIKIESFIFSTHLQPLTKYFRAKDFQRVLKNVSLQFSGWSGGTKIGKAIETLNETYSSVITPKTTVIIMSDGWDTGDIDLLDREMSKLRNRAKSIIWLNPLKGDLSYEPLALGMATAYPYCDKLISCHNMDSLRDFAKLLSK
jgi:uncharacterized protein with von Willebrand factor type A (vWA) domain